MVTDKERKRRRSSKRKSSNFTSSLSLPLVCWLLSSSSKVHLTRACVSPAASNTKAEAERTHTKWRDIVKKEKIYKGVETLGAERDKERDSETRWSLDYSAKTAPIKDAVLRRDSDFAKRCKNREEWKEERMRRCTEIQRVRLRSRSAQLVK